MLNHVFTTSVIALLDVVAAIPAPGDFIADAGMEVKTDYVPIEQGIEAVDISNATLEARDNIFFQGTFWADKNYGGSSKGWSMPDIGKGYYVNDDWNDRISSLYQSLGSAVSGDAYMCCRWYNDYDGSKCYGSSLTVTGKGYVSYVGDAQNDKISCVACWNYQGFC
ncbi:hypothetical protein F4677DRAFT_447993 [Hypoxylon crocopeplum]|nr:hypothetical protein F4677DRAFT_447993 [Hypoxylon crocopeplum]